MTRSAHLPLIAGALFAAPALAAPPVVLDGAFDDWRDVPILLVDPADATRAEVDLGAVAVSSDDRFVHLLLDFGREVNVQKLDGRLLLLLDADGSEGTGREEHGLRGTDAVITFTAPPTGSGREAMGVGLALTAGAEGTDAPALSPYDAGLTLAPTYASPRIELRIERMGSLRPGAAPLFAGRRFSGKLVFTDAAGAVIDETAPFAADLPPRGGSARPPEPATDPLVRASGTDLRVVSWNVEFASIVKEPDAALRVLAALDPDVVLLQELTDDAPAAELEELFSRLPSRPGRQPATPWRAVIGRPGGDLRSGVMSRLPMTASGHAEPILQQSQGDRSVRTAAAVVEVDGARVLVVSAHLKCCGRMGDRSDQTRGEEVAAIGAALRRAIAGGEADAIVIGGDLNLVGGRGPLDALVRGNDADGSDLAVASPFQLDGRSNATWSDPRQPFVPGRLDYLLYGDVALVATGAFILDGEDVAERWRRASGLEPTDVAQVSDHMPVVLDLAVR
jgi:endonuclease/exonuclease/phosphatase family metal-dependent hydrolase